MKLLISLIFITILLRIQSEPIRICGPGLSQLLAVVCNRNYNGRDIMKKSIDESAPHKRYISNKYTELNDKPEFQSDMLWMKVLSSKYHNTLAKTRRQRYFGGIYDECCRKSCEMEEMRSYCAL